MIDRDRAYLLKEAQRTLSESDTTAAFCLCQRWILKDTIALLKEQESVIEALKSDLDETLAVLGEQPEIVRCKDCKHRGNSEKCVLSAISEEKDFPLFMLDNRGEWFCADGERKEGM